jgi:hypothetical protein
VIPIAFALFEAVNALTRFRSRGHGHSNSTESRFGRTPSRRHADPGDMTAHRWHKRTAARPGTRRSRSQAAEGETDCVDHPSDARAPLQPLPPHPHRSVMVRLDSHYRSGRSPDWLKMKNSDAPAVKREAEEDWGRER